MAAQPPPNQKKPQQGGSLLTRKFGPLPAWGWVVLAVGAYYLYKKFSGSSSSSTVGTTAATITPAPQGTLSYTSPSGASLSGPAGAVTGLLGSDPSLVSGGAPASTAPGSSLVSGVSPSGLSVSGNPVGGSSTGVVSPGQGGSSPGNIGGVFGLLGSPVGSSPSAATAYELGSITGPGGAQYNVYDFPTGTAQSAQAAALYGSGAGAGAGFVQQGAYTPSSGFYAGQSLTVIPNSPGQAAPSTFGY